MSKRDRIFDINLEGFEELQREFQKAERDFRPSVKKHMTRFTLNVQGDAQKLVSVDSGELQSSIHTLPARETSEGIVTSVGTNNEYALRRHEEPYKQGVRPKYERGTKFDMYYINGRGYGTRNQPGVGQYKAGRKYMQNAVLYNESNFGKMCENILREVLK